MISVNELHVYTDGASRGNNTGNRGPSAIAYIIYDKDETKILGEHKESIGAATNNIAEYAALIKALEAATKLTKSNVKIFCDSKLII